jgi:nicotinamide mononucleotide transporter
LIDTKNFDHKNKRPQAHFANGRGLLEWSAVIANLLFTLLYLNESEWAFPMGIAGPLLLLVLSWREKLYAEPVLQVVYIASAVIGWVNTQSGWNSLQLEVSSHLLLFSTSTLAAVVWGLALKTFTSANFPLPDAAVASWGMLATWLMMYQVHECWIYLMVVNLLSIFIYYRRNLYAATVMYGIYLIMSIDGYWQLNWFTVQ